MENPFNINNGSVVVMICGDRDRVGYDYVVKNIKPNGNCEFHSPCDYCYGNIEEIGDFYGKGFNYILKENYKKR